ncbi:AzlD domain-containing protein [uncultured Selenomonas sp.]|uniref:branched-chain amino acid transporter permease n=1 Tax=uncultured Selenomonas sp. TaxID=159275 RepID=UPI0025EBD2C0|nr:AzlD domain-containing protein [uncultured Selenomonas sp.]
MTTTQQAITILVVVLGTLLTRFLPYLIFTEGRRVPQVITDLGRLLPPAVFGLLVVYCLRNVNIADPAQFIPTAIALVVTAALYFWRRDMLFPMAGGTVAYMVVLRMM